MARRARALVAVAAGVIALTGTAGIRAGWAHHGVDGRSDLAARSGGLPTRELTRVLGEDPKQNDEGLYTAKIDGRIYQTHGVDDLPPPSDEPDDGVAEGPLGERAPRCVTGGKHIHLLYGYMPGTAPGANWQSTIGEHIRTVTRQNNFFLNQQSLASSAGQVGADLKVRCNASGQIQVDAFEIVPIANDSKTSENESSWGVSDWRRIMAAGAKAGFNNTKVDYEVFTNAPGVSGIATWRSDERLTSKNENNNPGYPFGAGWAIVYASSWDRMEVSLHELGHAMGAVGNSAPHSSGAAHCWDEQDLMCYRDGGPLMPSSLVYKCSAVAWDCGYNDYFDAKTEPGEYLAGHWNLGNPLNAMIAFSGPGGTSTPTGPSADFTYRCSIQVLPLYKCSFTSKSEEGDAAISEYRWSFGDGATGTGLSPVHVFNSLIDAIKVLTRDVTLTVVDTNGMQNSVTKRIRLGAGGDDGSGDSPTSGNTTPVKIARIRPGAHGKAKVTVRAAKGAARGIAKLTSKQGGKSRTASVRFRGQASRVVRLRVPAGRSRLLIRFRPNRGSRSKVRYRVENRGRRIRLRRF